MRKMLLIAGIGAAALFAAPAANAAGPAQNTATAPGAQVQKDTVQATDVSSRRRYQRRYVRGYRSYAPAYGYYQQPYYAPAPAISFSFGGGGYGGGYGRGYGRRW